MDIELPHHQINVAIIGSRAFNNFEVAEKCIDNIRSQEIKQNVTIENIVSGGAKGADTIAEKYADKHVINKLIFKPDWSIGRHAGMLRNTEIIANSDAVIAFWDATSKGTLDSIKKSIKMKKAIYVFDFDGDLITYDVLQLIKHNSSKHK